MAYKVINGFNYPDGKGGEIRVNAGTVLDKLPPEYAADIIALGCIEGEGPAAVEPVVDELFSKADTQPLEAEEVD